MCGRTACALCKDEILSRLSAKFNGQRKFGWSSSKFGGDYQPSYNKAPGTYNPVVVSKSQVKNANDFKDLSEVVQVMRWGLVPSFVKITTTDSPSSSKFATSNARAENILERPSYMDCIKRRRRCVVVAQGFYEWKRNESGRKVPYFISVPEKGESLMLMAGVFSVNQETSLFTYSVITTNAVNEMAKIHDRMPVIFRDVNDILEWIDPSLCTPVATVRFLQHLVDNLKTLELKIYPVTPLMNSVSYDGPACIEPLDPSKPVVKKDPGTKTLDHFFAPKRKLTEETESTDEPESKKKAPHF